MEKKPIILIEAVTRANKFNFVAVYIGQIISEWPKHLPKSQGALKGQESSSEVPKVQDLFQSSFPAPKLCKIWVFQMLKILNWAEEMEIRFCA